MTQFNVENECLCPLKIYIDSGNRRSTSSQRVASAIYTVIENVRKYMNLTFRHGNDYDIIIANISSKGNQTWSPGLKLYSKLVPGQTLSPLSTCIMQIMNVHHGGMLLFGIRVVQLSVKLLAELFLSTRVQTTH